MRVNLLDEKKYSLEISWKEIFIVLVAVLVVLLLAGHYVYTQFQIGQLEQRLASQQHQLASLREREELYHELRRDIGEFTMPEEYRIRQPEISEAFKELSNNMPMALTLQQIRFAHSNVTFSGYTRDVWPLLSLMLNLIESDLYEQVSVNHFRRDGEIIFNITARLPGKEE